MTWELLYTWMCDSPHQERIDWMERPFTFLYSHVIWYCMYKTLGWEIWYHMSNNRIGNLILYIAKEALNVLPHFLVMLVSTVAVRSQQREELSVPLLHLYSMHCKRKNCHSFPSIYNTECKPKNKTNIPKNWGRPGNGANCTCIQCDCNSVLS